MAAAVPEELRALGGECRGLRGRIHGGGLRTVIVNVMTAVQLTILLCLIAFNIF